MTLPELFLYTVDREKKTVSQGEALAKLAAFEKLTIQQQIELAEWKYGSST